MGADDRANWFHRMDIVVNPSYQEGLPTTVVEAILAQCVVVATDVGGTREITNQDDLILIPAGDEQACARALVEALDQYQHLAGLSTQEVYDRFVPEATIRQYREMVDALVVG